MHTTENFGLSQFDATDIFNPMTVNNENAQKIDAQMKLNKDASLGIATELVSQGVHALTRLSDYETCNFFKFTATSNYEAGETFVVDGVQVQAKTVAGSNLASGAYIIGSTVLCELRDALLTIFVPGAQTADDSLALNGHPDTYFGTAEDVAAAQATATAAGNLADQNRADIVQIKSNLFAIKEVLHVASTTATATDYTTEPLDGYDFFIISAGVLGFRPSYLYNGSATGFYSKAELLDTSNYTYGTQLKVYDADGVAGPRITVIKYVDNTTIKIRYNGSYPTEVRIYGIKCNV